MKNKEIFSKELLEFACKANSFGVIKKTNELLPCDCSIRCCDCIFNDYDYDCACEEARQAWCEEEYKDPFTIDWNNVKVDTRILVSNDESTWYNRYFAKYEDGKVYAFDAGASSWSNEKNTHLVEWKYAKLFVDWSKVKVDTPILVKDGEDGVWLKRYFAKYKDSEIYAFVDGYDSKSLPSSYSHNDDDCSLPWNYAILFEDNTEENYYE